ncbi:MAG TPA: transposase family protein [Streptosporangiaceae bacterium]|nr:transposase family protein [Streptosporangiaceae bacterium]
MPGSHARAAVWSLLVMLADISDPRDPRGVRHRLVAVLGVAVVATLAGAASYRELGSVAAGLPQELLSLLGARWDLAAWSSSRPVQARTGGC